MATEENNARLQAQVTVTNDAGVSVLVTEKDKRVGLVTFGETCTTIVLEKAYTNWSRQVVRLARTTAGV